MNGDLETLSKAALMERLFGGSILFAPIRHHSPACAWAVRQMIRDHRPTIVFIEAPEDLGHHLPMFSEPDLVFPVAILTEPEAETGTIRYFPFAVHSPETLAIQTAIEIGAELRFIDLPSARRSKAPNSHHSIQPFSTEHPFDSARFIGAMCDQLGLRDGTELWDHLFESRLGESDWRGFFADVYAYCLALRETTDPETMEQDQTLLREAVMRRHVNEVQGERVVVVTGGFHTPALISTGAISREKPAPRANSWMIGYGQANLDQRTGYGAGLRVPEWHLRQWQAAEEAGGPPDPETVVNAVVHEFALHQAERGNRIAVPQQVELFALTFGLAQMRGRASPLVCDLRDGIQSALIKGEAVPTDPILVAFDQFLHRSPMGRAPRAAGLPPLVMDVRERLEKHRFDVSLSADKTRKLDIWRNEPHAQASRYCHQLSVIGAGFATLKSGPDFIRGTRMGLLHEEWVYAWTPLVEARLIQLAHLGSTLPMATARHLDREWQKMIEEGRQSDLPALVELFLSGLRCGLGRDMASLFQALETGVHQAGSLPPLAHVMRRLFPAFAPDHMLADPKAPPLGPLVQAAFQRFLWLCDTVPHSPDDDLPDIIAAMDVMFSLLRQPEGPKLAADRLDHVIMSLFDNRTSPPLIRGAMMGLLGRGGMLGLAEVAKALTGGLSAIGAKSADKAAVLDGFLRTAPMLLWQSTEILAAMNTLIDNLDDTGFLSLLPNLRHSLTRLDPHEAVRLSHEVATLLGISRDEVIGKSPFDPRDAALGLDLDGIIRATRAKETGGEAYAQFQG